MRDLLKRAWKAIKGIRWGYGALFAVYTIIVYLRLIDVFGSTFLGTVVLYVTLCIVASIMRRKPA